MVYEKHTPPLRYYILLQKLPKPNNNQLDNKNKLKYVGYSRIVTKTEKIKIGKTNCWIIQLCEKNWERENKIKKLLDISDLQPKFGKIK